MIMYLSTTKAFCFGLLLSQASGHPSLSSASGEDTLATRNDISITSAKYQKNCQRDDGIYSKAETEAWDTMKKLADAAKRWEKHGNYQKTAEMYFGGDAADEYDRIQQNFKYVSEWHDRNFWIGPNTPRTNALYEVWCEENGPDGKIPKPDDWKGDWDGGACGLGTYAYSFTRSRWWWLRTVYDTVICRNGWLKRFTLQQLNRDLDKDKVTMDTLFTLRAATWLHETLHHKVVADPRVEDLLITGPQACYGPDASAALAKYWGAVKDLKNEDGGYDGEFGAIKNADNYVAFALSVYFQEELKIADPIEPAGPWRTIPKEQVNPVPRRKANNGGFTVYGAWDTADKYEAGVVNEFQNTKDKDTSRRNDVECVDANSVDPEQQPFNRDDAIKSINEFCSNKDYQKLQIITPVSFGTGKTSDGRGKTQGLDNSQGTPPDNTVSNGIWLSASIANRDGCGASYKFGHGNDEKSATEYCTSRFTDLLDNCQTDTRTAKYGGSLAYGCEYYQIAGRYGNSTAVFANPSKGNLQCTPAAADSQFPGTCSCSYSNYYGNDNFKMPKSGKCGDVDAEKDWLSVQSVQGATALKTATGLLPNPTHRV